MRLLLVIAIALVGCAPTPPRCHHYVLPDDRTAITSIVYGQAAAWNRGDLDGYMAPYLRADELVFTSGGKVRRGFLATYEAFRNKYAQDPAAMGKLEFKILSIDTVGGDGAIVLGEWALTASPSDGKGIFSVIFERRTEGRAKVWRIVHDHTSLAPG